MVNRLISYTQVHQITGLAQQCNTNSARDGVSEVGLFPSFASALLQERRWWVFFVALDDVDEKRAEEKIDNFFQKVAQQGSVW